jgi:hypothetical protein
MKYHVLYVLKNQKEVTILWRELKPIQRETNQLPSFIIDLEHCKIEKETEVMFTLESNKKQYNFKFSQPELKEEWMILFRASNGKE